MDHYTEGKHPVGLLAFLCLILWSLAYFLYQMPAYSQVSAVFCGLATVLTPITGLQAYIEFFTDHELI